MGDISRRRPAPDAAQLSRLEVGGTAVAGFRGDCYTYRVVGTGAVPAIRTVAATSGARVAVTTTGASWPSVATVTVTAPGTSPGVYRIVFMLDPSLQPGVPVASDTDIPGRAVDGDPGTWWASSESGQWLRIDLGNVASLSAVTLSWFATAGSPAYSRFDLEVSDGGPWQAVVTDGHSDGTADPQEVTFASVEARYVRYVARGRSANADGSGATSTWNSVRELAVPGRSLVDAPDIAPRLAQAHADIPTELAPGSTYQVHPSGTLDNADAADLGSATVTYQSSATDVLTVDESGTLTAVADGTAAVTTVIDLGGYVRWFTASVVVGPLADRTIAANADSYVRGGTLASTNYGAESLLHVKGGTDDYLKRAAIGFGVVAGTVSTAVLRVEAAQPTGQTDSVVDVRPLPGSWQEGTVTAGNLPTPGAGLGTVAVSSTKGWRELDVTAYVQERAEAGEPVSFLLEELVSGGEPHDISISARESGANAPQLVITV